MGGAILCTVENPGIDVEDPWLDSTELVNLWIREAKTLNAPDAMVGANVTDEFAALVVDASASWDAHVDACIPAERRSVLRARGYLP